MKIGGRKSKEVVRPRNLASQGVESKGEIRRRTSGPKKDDDFAKKMTSLKVVISPRENRCKNGVQGRNWKRKGR